MRTPFPSGSPPLLSNLIFGTDSHYDQVFGLSLASACKFRFRRKSGTRWERYTLDAQPRSLYVMTGAARRVWEHSIPPVEKPRYSITFRTME